MLSGPFHLGTYTYILQQGQGAERLYARMWRTGRRNRKEYRPSTHVCLNISITTGPSALLPCSPSALSHLPTRGRLPFFPSFASPLSVARSITASFSEAPGLHPPSNFTFLFFFLTFRFSPDREAQTHTRAYLRKKKLGVTGFRLLAPDVHSARKQDTSLTNAGYTCDAHSLRLPHHSLKEQEEERIACFQTQLFAL